VSAVANAETADAAPSAASVRERVPDWLVLGLTCFGQFMVILDASIVNVALPSIRSGLGFTPTGLQWVVNSYLLTFGGFLLLGGRSTDLFGRRRMLTAGLVLFAAASLACGLAPAAGVLVAARAAQGLGAAILAPAVLAVLTTRFTEDGARGRALSIWAAAGAAGGVLGGVVGGGLTAALSWRWIFLVNVPIGAGLIGVTAVALVGGHRRGADDRLDLPGALSVTAGMALLIYGIVQTDTDGWGSTRVLAPVVTGLALVGLFVLVEARLAARPMLPLRLLRSAAVSAGMVLLILVGSLSIGIWYFASLFFQNVLGYSAIQTGLALSPAAGSLMVTASCVPVLLSRTGPRRLVGAGCLCQLVGFGWFAHAGATSGYPADLLGPTVLVAVGMGLVFTPTTVAVTSRVTGSDAGIVSGLANASRQLGSSLGLAALATVATARTESLLAGHRAGGQPAALASGYDRAFLVAAGVAVVAGLVSRVLPSRAGRRPPAEP